MRSCVCLLGLLFLVSACGGSKESTFPGRDGVRFQSDETKHGDTQAAQEAGLIRYSPGNSWAVYVPKAPRLTKASDDLYIGFSMGTGAAYSLLIRPVTDPAELAAPRIALKRLHAVIEGRRQKEGKSIDYPIRWFQYMGMPAYDEYSPGDFGPELSRTVAVGDSVVTLTTMALFEPNDALNRSRDAFFNSLTVVPPKWQRYAPSARWSAEFPGTPILDPRPSGVTVHSLSILPQNIYIVSESRKEKGQKGPKEALESFRGVFLEDGLVQLSQIAEASAGGVSGLSFSFHNSEAGLAGLVASFMVDSHLMIFETRWQTSAAGAKEASNRFIESIQLGAP